MTGLPEGVRYRDASCKAPDESGAGPGHALQKAPAINAVRACVIWIGIQGGFDRMNTMS